MTLCVAHPPKHDKPPTIRYISCLISASSHKFSAAITLAAMHSSTRSAQPPQRRKPHGAPAICLCDAKAFQNLPGRKAGAEQHLALLPARREDRRGGRERLGQVHAPEDHGGGGEGASGRGLGRRWRARGLSPAGAAARRDEGRARQRDGGRGGEEGHARPL